MSYDLALEATKAKYPFRTLWRERYFDGLAQYTVENCAKAEAIFDKLIASLIAFGRDAAEETKLAAFQSAVEDLNALNDAAGGVLIETGEREELCELCDTIARAALIDVSAYGAGDGVASEWRDW